MGGHLCRVLWDHHQLTGLISCRYGMHVLPAKPSVTAEHKYPPLILFLKEMMEWVEMSVASKRGKTKGSSLDKSCQESFLIRLLTQNIKMLAWCAMSKMHAGLCWECFEMDGVCGTDGNQTISENITFVLACFLSFIFLQFFFYLRTDAPSFIFALDLKPVW